TATRRSHWAASARSGGRSSRGSSEGLRSPALPQHEIRAVALLHLRGHPRPVVARRRIEVARLDARAVHVALALERLHRDLDRERLALRERRLDARDGAA